MLCHIDADSFFASVLQRTHPHLQGKPLLAIGMGGGIVIAASYEAKGKGVKTGMPLKEAMRLVPDAIRMAADFRETALASRQIEDAIREFCPIIEQMSVDEWFLDLRTLPGGIPNDLLAWGKHIQQTILRSTALSVSIGIAPTKLLAKMAGEEQKPAGVTVVMQREIPGSLERRPAAAIPGIGRARQVQADVEGWKTAWDIAQANTDTLVHLFGKPGKEMQQELQGLLIHAVTRIAAPPKSVSRARSFRGTRDTSLLWAHIFYHLQYLVLKMRRHRLMCRGVSLWLRTDQYRYQGTQQSLPRPSDTEEAIAPYIKRCFRDIYDRECAYTQAGVALFPLTPRGPVQHSLFEEPGKPEQEEQLQRSLDRIRELFGKDAIARGSALRAKGRKTSSVFGLPLVEEGKHLS